tara:strand:+ start:2115 stop:2384 length:270 start_codon:yes stop_codon:yes gene_type:complete
MSNLLWTTVLIFFFNTVDSNALQEVNDKKISDVVNNFLHIDEEDSEDDDNDDDDDDDEDEDEDVIDYDIHYILLELKKTSWRYKKLLPT